MSDPGPAEAAPAQPAQPAQPQQQQPSHNPSSTRSRVPPIEPEDETEWEYEYSTTETETYYLTVDLSLPEFVYRVPSGVMHFGRGGYYADWINDPESEHRRAVAHRIRPRAFDDDEDDDEDDALPEPEDDIDEDDVQDAPREADTEVVDDKLVPRDIEILDLHTHHPIISYRGKVFEGSWAEILGTELIFADASAPPPSSSLPVPTVETAPLPALRRLPGNVDLLAASSARILTREKTLRIPAELDRLKQTRDAFGIRLPVIGKYRHEERKKQVRFLENLTALKMKKGERDQVTINARPAPDKNFQDDRDPDWQPRRKRQKTETAGAVAGRGRGGTAVPGAAGFGFGLGTGAGAGRGRGGARKPLPFSRPTEPVAAVTPVRAPAPVPDAWAGILPGGEGDESEEEEESDEEDE